MSGRALVIAVGSPFRRDDSVGLRVAEKLRARGVPVAESAGDGAELLEMMRGAERVVLVDAIRSGCEPGTVVRIGNVPEALTDAVGLSSSHLLGLAGAVRMAEALGGLPCRLALIGIEGGEFGFGEEPSPEVAAAVDRAVEMVLAEIGSDG